jgi:hypothetical protein
MLKALELENFKAFGNRTRIEFAPITLIFGENSAGKSSILQALNLLKQTRESREHGSVLLPRAESGIVDLGSFQELIFDHKTDDRSLTIRVEMSSQRGRFFPRRLVRSATGPGQADVGYEVSFRRRPNDNEVILEHLILFLGEKPEPTLRFEPTELDPEERRSIRQQPFYWRTRRPIRPSELRAAKCVAITEDPDLWADLYDLLSRRSRRLAITTSSLRPTASTSSYDYFGGSGKHPREDFRRAIPDLDLNSFRSFTWSVERMDQSQNDFA